jgi:hypothetical protein
VLAKRCSGVNLTTREPVFLTSVLGVPVMPDEFYLMNMGGRDGPPKPPALARAPGNP